VGCAAGRNGALSTMLKQSASATACGAKPERCVTSGKGRTGEMGGSIVSGRSQRVTIQVRCSGNLDVGLRTLARPVSPARQSCGDVFLVCQMCRRSKFCCAEGVFSQPVRSLGGNDSTHRQVRQALCGPFHRCW